MNGLGEADAGNGSRSLLTLRAAAASASPSPPTGLTGNRRAQLPLVVLLTAGFLCSSAGATVGDGWRWPRTNLNKPVKVRVVVDAQFDRALLPELRGAAKMWQSPDLRLDVAAKPVPSCDPIVAQTICVSSPKPGEGPCPDMGGCSWQAGTMPYLSYARAWIVMRDVTAGDTGWVRHVFCHELGHNIGLGHTEDGPAPYQPSCMSNDFAYYSVGPSRDDLAFLRSLYSTVTP